METHGTRLPIGLALILIVVCTRICEPFPFTYLLRAGTHAMFHAVDLLSGWYDHASMPPLQGPNIVVSAHKDISTPPGASWSYTTSRDNSSGRSKPLYLHIMQYNALTFSPSQSHPSGHGDRVPYMQPHLVEQTVDLACFQEARTKGPTIRKLNHYFAAASGSNNGHHACELWVSRRLCSHENLNIVYSDPRVLLVTIRSSKISLDVLTFHAPTSCSPRVERSNFWKHNQSSAVEVVLSCAFRTTRKPTSGAPSPKPSGMLAPDGSSTLPRTFNGEPG